MTIINRLVVEKALTGGNGDVPADALMRVANLSEEDMAAGLASTAGLRALYQGQATELTRREAPGAARVSQVAAALAEVASPDVVAVRVPVDPEQTSDAPFYSVLLTGDTHELIICTLRE